jgi:FkbM family methyltransferase
MAQIDRFLVDSFSGNFLEPEGHNDPVTPEEISRVKKGEVYKGCGIDYTPTRVVRLNRTRWDTQHSEIFQVRVFYWLIEMVCQHCNDLPITMVELGAGGGLYSQMFSELTRDIFKKESRNVCTELMPHEVDGLIKRLPKDTTDVFCGYHGTLDPAEAQGFNISYDELIKKIKRYSLEDVLSKSNLNKVDFLHIDIQGGELDIIKEVAEKGLFDKIRYFFISTHNHIIPDIHLNIKEILKEHANILIDREQGDGWACGDGFILAESLDNWCSHGSIPDKYCTFNKEFNDIPAVVQEIGRPFFLVGQLQDNGMVKLVPSTHFKNPEQIPLYSRISVN